MGGRKKSGLGPRLLVQVGGTVALAMCVMIAVVIAKTRSSAMEQAYDTAEQLAFRHAAAVEVKMNDAMSAARTMARTFEAALPAKDKIDRDYFDRMLANVLGRDLFYFGTWVMTEPNAFDGRDAAFVGMEGQAPDGSFGPYATRDNGAISVDHSASYDEAKDKTYYTVPMRSGEESVIEPYFESEADNALIGSVAVPIFENGKTIGVAGIDVLLDSFSELAAGIKPWGDGYAFILSNAGAIVGHPNKSLASKRAEEIGVSDKALEAVRMGEEFEEHRFDSALGEKFYFKYVPVRIGASKAPWSLAVGIPMDNILADSELLSLWIGGIGFAGLIVLLGVLVAIARSIVLPVKKTVESLRDIAAGELSKRLEGGAVGELGELAEAFNAFADKIQAILAAMRKASETLVSSAGKLSSTSNLLAETATQVRESSRQSAESSREAATAIEVVSGSAGDSTSKMESVAGAVDHMSADAGDIASAAEQMSASVNSVSAAIEEMSASLREVAQTCVQSAAASQSSSEKANQALSQMASLTEAATRIGKVVELIEDIADQTNLLALNATIEAASAGEVGKGFAVVAGEVKALARQTAKATDEIAERVSTMQAGTETAASMIREMFELSEQVHSLTSAISAAVEEQSATTNEVSKNVAAGAVAARDISESVQRISDGIRDVALRTNAVSRDLGQMSASAAEASSGSAGLKRSIEIVAVRVDHVAEGAEVVRREAGDLHTVAAEIRGLVGQFRI